jgi:alkyl sulfatase BDS1-like metallo-beta-lactamase superfamily hydrolase
VLALENAVLHARRGDPDPAAVATVRVTRELFVRLMAGQAGLREIVFSDDLAVDGSRLELLGFLSLLDRSATGAFPIVTP